MVSISIESLQNISQFIQTFPYAFKKTTRKEIEAALRESSDRIGSSAEQIGSAEDRLSLCGLFPIKSRVVSSLRNICFYLSEEEYYMLKTRERIVGGKNHGWFGRSSNKEERGKHLIIYMTGLHEN